MSKSAPVYIGISGTVLALDPTNGTELWKSVLKKDHFITVCMVGETLLAAVSGELYRLDPADGKVLWHNKLKGLGQSFITIAGSDVVAASAALQQQQAAMTAAIIATSAASASSS